MKTLLTEYIQNKRAMAVLNITDDDPVNGCIHISANICF